MTLHCICASTKDATTAARPAYRNKPENQKQTRICRGPIQSHPRRSQCSNIPRSGAKTQSSLTVGCRIIRRAVEIGTVTKRTKNLHVNNQHIRNFCYPICTFRGDSTQIDNQQLVRLRNIECVAGFSDVRNWRRFWLFAQLYAHAPFITH